MKTGFPPSAATRAATSRHIAVARPLRFAAAAEIAAKEAASAGRPDPPARHAMQVRLRQPGLTILGD